MSSSTAFMSIPKPDGTDAFADGDDIMRAIAERVDYLLGESGETTIAPSSASTKFTKVIAFGRTYKTPPRVLLSLGGDGYTVNIAGGALALWVDDVSTTDVTIAINSTATTQRTVTYLVRPKRTDVTP